MNIFDIYVTTQVFTILQTERWKCPFVQQAGEMIKTGSTLCLRSNLSCLTVEKDVFVCLCQCGGGGGTVSACLSVKSPHGTD